MKFQTLNLVKSAEEARNKGNLEKAASLYTKAMEVDPEEMELKLKYGSCLFTLGKYKESAKFFHDLHMANPNNRKVMHGCAISYLNLGQFTMAIQFLKKLVATDPKDYESWINLSFAAGSISKTSDALFYAMQAMQLRPLSPQAHNNLGSTLMALGRHQDALISFETARALNPDGVEPLTNIAKVYSTMGETERSLEILAQCVKMAGQDTEKAKTIQYKMSFDLFRLGQLEEGWKMYDFGFVPKDLRSRHPKRQFGVPLWDGRALENETLLIWREQGLGDEIIFLSVLQEVQQRVKHVVVECDKRSVAPLSRSFPGVTFRPSAFLPAPSCHAIFSDFDYHIPMGSLMGIFRNSVADFDKATPYIVPDRERQDEFRRRLAALSNKPKVGVCWRSGKLDAERNTTYTSISDWEPILRLENVDFVNLQYGDCSEELANVAQHYGVTIHQWPDLNLKDDLDGIYALMSCLDRVVSVKTAVADMAGAVGTPTSLIVPRTSWVLFGTGEYRFFPNVRTHCDANRGALKELIPEVAAALAEEFGAVESPA